MRALQNAVRGGTEGHAYLFSGPRGTGKTSTARILAKALNCENLQDGEPCCECGSCLEIEAGRSFDLFELDAASNNGVDAIRDLIERSVVGSPGRNKVYILDEVHMLSAAASNALLKTLEEPPEHVCFVLATTDPQKVLPTIKSRTQHFEFQLLSAAELEDYVRWIAADAGLDVDDQAVAYVVRQGRGSARDTLSALDQVVAAGGVITRSEPVDQLLQSLADRNTGSAIVAVADALAHGHDPRVLGDALLTSLRDAFLLSLGVEVPHLVDADRERLGGWAERLGTATLTRAMESVGTALVDMRQAADPRVPLEVALVRLTAAQDSSVDGLAERLEAVERAVANGAASGGGGRGAPAPQEAPARTRERPAPATPASRATSAPAAAPAAPAVPAPEVEGGPAAAPDDGAPTGDAAGEAAAEPTVSGDGPAQARAALGALRAKQGRNAPSGRSAGAAPPAAPGPPPARPAAPSRPRRAEPAPSPGPQAQPPAGSEAPAAGAPAVGATAPAPPAGGAPDRDALALAFGDVVMPALKGMSKAIYSGGRFVAVTDRGAVFALDNAPTRDRAEKYRADVEAALAAHLGSPVTLILIDQADAARYGSDAPAPARASAAPTPEPPAPERPPAAAPEDPAAPVAAPAPGGDGGTAPTPDGPADVAPDDTADDEDPAMIDVTELEDATDVATSGIDKLTKAFPGAVLVEDGEGSP